MNTKPKPDDVVWLKQRLAEAEKLIKDMTRYLDHDHFCLIRSHECKRCELELKSEIFLKTKKF